MPVPTVPGRASQSSAVPIVSPPSSARCDVGRVHVVVVSDLVDDLGDVPARELLDLAARHARRVADDAAFPSAERDVGDGELPRHPRRERGHFIEGHIGVVADAALRGPERDVVLHAVAGEDFDLAVVHQDWT